MNKKCHMFVSQAMEAQQAEGKARAIGVSNFNRAQLQRLMDTGDVVPEVLQVEIHAHLQQHNLVKFCQDNNIAVCAYSPLGSRGTAQLYNDLGIRSLFTPLRPVGWDQTTTS